ncbi:hypothetical protein HYS96_04175 [Candidatus Daviesbacteria bacterium]|nr:hypothetical protein [Candidatus Daviesbacteria bacterium]
MKTLIIVLIIAAFIQTTLLPLDLLLIILICRAYIKTGKENLYLAFLFGLLISHLTLTLIGVKSVLYLILIQITQVLSKSRLAGNSVSLIPLVFVLLSANQITNVFLLQQTIQIFPRILIESIISLPILYLIRLWEERFIVRADIKLKV